MARAASVTAELSSEDLKMPHRVWSDELYFLRRFPRSIAIQLFLMQNNIGLSFFGAKPVHD